MARAIIRHRRIHIICYIYKPIETFEGRCEEPQHNPPSDSEKRK